MSPADSVATPARNFSFAVDRGGTFTDVVATVVGADGVRRTVVEKLLSVDPSSYSDAPTEGIRRILESETGVAFPRGVPIDTSRVAEIRMGTTVATNALLERKGERFALVVTKGFRDVLHIGNQSRPRIFDLEIRCPESLYSEVMEVDELVSIPLDEAASSRSGAAASPRPSLAGTRVTGTTGEALVVRTAPDAAVVEGGLRALRASGYTAVAVLLKHAALYPAHELLVGRIAISLGFTHVSLSHQVLNSVKMVPRGHTACADAYLTPRIREYLAAFTSGFDAGLSSGAVRLSFQMSDGALATASAFSGHRAILSGPAGGVVGYAATTQWEGTRARDLQIVGFDMGGTSTDVSRVAGGEMERVFETTTAGVSIAAPQLDVNTVAAGGGSALALKLGLFAVGPASVGAHPGPVCYKKGGRLAVTDANLQLGRIQPAFFPHIFGADEKQPLDEAATRAAFVALAARVNLEAAPSSAPMSVDEVAYGFVRVANEAMCRPIRALTNARGFDASHHVLACFGGAGGQHCCAIARALRMRTVFVHRLASVLSAVGIGLADTAAEARQPASESLRCAADAAALAPRLDGLAAEATARLVAQGFDASSVRCERFLAIRFDGTDVTLMVPQPADGDYCSAFKTMYAREFGFLLERELRVDDLRVRATAAGGGTSADAPPPSADAPCPPAPPPPPPPPAATASVYFEGGRVATPVWVLSALPRGCSLPGPSLLVDAISTVVVEPGCVAHVTADGSLRIDVGALAGVSTGADAEDAIDPVTLSIFGNRFMGIAEQMGRTLQRTSISVNIKERLDFSCALFGPDGGLVANAPHLPVHLGAMQSAVAFQLSHWSQPGREGLRDGDVLVSNHPQLAGGSHLPDLTVITPVFDGDELIFFVASRGHHADVGGITPGSMPPKSTRLSEEGAAIVAHKLVRRGVFDEAGMVKLLAGGPGSIGSRCVSDNLSDLRAQAAANTRGVALVRQLIEEKGLRVVQRYMHAIQAAAESAVRSMLTRFAAARGLPPVGTVCARDRLDDGSVIDLVVTIDSRDGSAVFDFSGTGPEVLGNLNAPPAVTYSAVIYALRCLVAEDVPLNQGCLAPVKIVIPQGCLLRPSPTAAVVGGNVLTSQRVTDVVLAAFGAAAASQGCMNNLTFGDEGMGYYETIAGGAGAGPTWHGRSGVHTHMTNTRITDPEILERRFPVCLRTFTLRPGSGGRGRWRGGDGCVRELEMLRPLTVGILSERRSLPPPGMAGGGDGQRGLNLWVKADGAVVNLGAKAAVEMGMGDRIRILTPGGGGYGAPEETECATVDAAAPSHAPPLRGGSGSLAAYAATQEGA